MLIIQIALGIVLGTVLVFLLFNFWKPAVNLVVFLFAFSLLLLVPYLIFMLGVWVWGSRTSDGGAFTLVIISMILIAGALELISKLTPQRAKNVFFACLKITFIILGSIFYFYLLYDIGESIVTSLLTDIHPKGKDLVSIILWLAIGFYIHVETKWPLNIISWLKQACIKIYVR